MRSDYQSRTIGTIALMDGGNPNDLSLALYKPPLWSRADTIYNLFGLGYATILNRTGGAVSAGIGARLRRELWKAGQVDAAGAYTDDTVDAQDTDTNDFALESLVNNAGFLVASVHPINCICIDVTTASNGGTPVREIQYSKAGGTWGTLTATIIVPPASFVIGETLIWWAMPPDQALLEAGHGTGVPVGLYGYRVRATTAPTTTAALAKSLSVAEVINIVTGLATGVEHDFSPSVEVKFQAPADALVAVISSKAQQGCIVSAAIRLRG